MNTIPSIPLILLICSLAAGAQNIDEPNDKLKTKFVQRGAIKVEYFGELVLHPGLSMGIDYTVKEHKWVTVHWNTDLGAYWHKWNNTSVFLKTTMGSRFSIGSFFTDINLGVGYMHTWAAGEMYEKDGNGGAKKATNRGHAHFITNTSLLMGWDGSRKHNLPWMIYIGPEVYLQSSFNHIFLPHMAAKVGFTYKFN